jgi:hypothetical protein
MKNTFSLQKMFQTPLLQTVVRGGGGKILEAKQSKKLIGKY